ncbi:hypothetical protein CSKR_202954 [Clonorchis sinensis]|uniref:Secreted protein n=1 Tax=Clonorchis sinensis TaxID=79923 RepID=A0A8T1M4U1_CLOSI|nr:hypothetical protein CSKR_202954 [Clonorchis sinensis]
MVYYALCLLAFLHHFPKAVDLFSPVICTLVTFAPSPQSEGRPIKLNHCAIQIRSVVRFLSAPTPLQAFTPSNLGNNVTHALLFNQCGNLGIRPFFCSLQKFCTQFRTRIRLLRRNYMWANDISWSVW